MKKWNKDYSRLRGRHFVLELGTKDDQRASCGIQTRHTHEKFEDALKRMNKFKRSNCILCKTKVSTQCEQCNVFLCTKTVSGVKNCFKTFHTERNFMPGGTAIAEIDEEMDMP